jgi:hypothetical protein
VGRQLDRVRKIALALPEVNERLSHGEPCFFVRDKRPLCYFHDNHNLQAAHVRDGGLLGLVGDVPRYVGLEQD